MPIDSQISEVKYAISQGAKEIDLVIDRGLAIEGDFKTLYYNVNTIKGICEEHNVILKTILSVAELESYTLVYKAALTVMMAGSNFICTSTGTCVTKTYRHLFFFAKTFEFASTLRSIFGVILEIQFAGISNGFLYKHNFSNIDKGNV